MYPSVGDRKNSGKTCFSAEEVFSSIGGAGFSGERGGLSEDRAGLSGWKIRSSFESFFSGSSLSLNNFLLRKFPSKSLGQPIAVSLS